MSDTKKILESIKDKIAFQPIDDRILVKPLKPVKVRKKVPIYPEPPAEDATAKEKMEFNEKEIKFETKSVDSNMTKAVVLKIGKTGSITNIPFEEGDVIVYPTNAGMPFELFKDTRLLKRYEIMGLWQEN